MLKVFDESPHFLHREQHSGADAAVAGNGGGCPAEGVGDAPLTFEFPEEGGHLLDDVAGAEAGGDGPDDGGALAEGFRIEPEAAE